MKLISYCNRIIEYSFYTLFFLVPLVFSGDTSELFELNKIWLTFGVTIIIAAAWITKMVMQRKISIQKTLLDIPIILFLFSQIIASILSLDQHISWWGYYSRFNGGLLSTLCYIFLYYAFASNLTVKHVLKSLIVSLFSGLAVALWGFPSHFGADPTCLVFRGTFDTSCWTDAFKPTIRAFSTLGQPAWLAAYMAFLIPISMTYLVKYRSQKGIATGFLLLTILLYLLLIFAATRAGFIAFWVVNILFWTVLFSKKLAPKQYLIRIFAILTVLFVFCSFVFDSPLGSLSKYTLPELTKSSAPTPTQPTTTAATPSTGGDITDSGNIRLLVWNGAIKAWEHNPFFGTGVETFAFAYYKYKSPAHNLTSEWDYLYNKAHNEYLNYLATTGAFGLGSYVAFILLFLFLSGKWILQKHAQQKNQEADSEINTPSRTLLVTGLVAGFISILISNFFGFSVVIVNLYLFLVPVFLFLLTGMLKEQHRFLLPATKHEADISQINPYQWTSITIIIGIACWMLLGLLWYRQADIAYALGNNLDKTGNYQEAYPQLLQAIQAIPSEPVYKDEFAINLAAISAGFYSQKDATHGAMFAKNAIALSNEVVTNHPNNVIYWKNRVRLFYTLSASDKSNEAQYLQEAIKAIDTAKVLAPTDAKIAYNQGILYGQIGEKGKAAQILNETIKLKPDYAASYIALGLFYHELAIDKNGKVTDPDMQKKAIDTYEYFLKHLAPEDKEVQKNLEAWRASQ